MRILHVLDHSLPLHSGYTFRTRAILKAGIARGWEVRGVTCPRYNKPEPSPDIADGLTFYRTPPARKSLPILDELREVHALGRAIDRAIADWRPDVLHAHSPALVGLAALGAARRSSIPLLYEIRAFWEDAAVGNGTGTEGSLRYRLIRTLETHVVRRADAVAVICEGLKADLMLRGIMPDKMFVSPNGVDLALFGDPPPPDAQRAEQLGLTGKDVIGFIGSFYDYEGLDDLITSMPLLPGVELLLVGGGPMEASLRQLAASSSACDRIHFIGRVPHEEVEHYYSLIDILVYPRKAMRLTDLVTPLKPLEAMAQRRLVAASDVGGHRELIEHGETGTLFPPDDPSALASAVAAMFADRAGWDRRRGGAREFVERDRNWNSNVSRYEPVYRKLAGKSE